MDPAARTVPSFCRICEALCGTLVDVEGDQVVAVRGDPDHVASKGFLCPKGAAMPRVMSDPDRVLEPLERQPDGTFATVTWDHALDRIAERLRSVIDAHGPGSVGCYSGNPLAYGPAGHMWNKKLLDGIGTSHAYSAATQDATSRFVANFYLYGSPMALPIPDIPSTSFFLCVGANPLVSNGSLLSIGRIRDQLNSIVERSGRVVVVDPIATSTAKAFEHIPVVPGTDIWLLAAMIRVLFEEGLVASDVEQQAERIDELRAAVAPFDTESAAARTGIEAATIVDLTRAFASAESAVAYGRLGLCRGTHPTTANYLLDALNVLTGNFDRRGGAVFGAGLVDWAGMMARMGRSTLGSTRSRVGDLPEVTGRRPMVITEEITTEGPGQIRAMFLMAGNPVSSTPNGKAMGEAFRQLELLVSIDLYLTESSIDADYVLPATSFYERPDLVLSFGGNMPEPWTHYTDAVVEPRGQAREEWWIVNEILHRIGAPSPGDPWDEIRSIVDASDMALEHGWTLAVIAEHPHGVDLGGSVPVGDAAERIAAFTEGRTSKVDLGAPEVLDELSTIRTTPGPSNGELLLVGRREVRSMNSWLHNVRGGSGSAAPTLFVHPDDAATRGIVDGTQVEVRSHVGSVEVPARVTSEVVAGSVSYPHGWGHAGSWRRAVEVGGVNINDVIPNDVGTKERLSGMSFMDGVPVQVMVATTSDV